MKKRILKRTKIILPLIIGMYILSYFALSRLSIYINKDYYVKQNDRGFYYVPCDEIYFKDKTMLQWSHIGLVYFYYPIWAIDYYLFNGPEWSTSFPDDFGISEDE